VHNYNIENEFSPGKSVAIIRVFAPFSLVIKKRAKSPKLGAENVVHRAIWSTLLKRIVFNKIFCCHLQGSFRRAVQQCAHVEFGY
jgi:hypothetical protein